MSAVALDRMPTLVLDPPPAELQALIERREKLGQDLFDEVWEGVLHMNPAPAGAHGQLEKQLTLILAPLAKRAALESTGQFNLGDGPDDFRVPDGGFHRDWQNRVYYATAALVLEIVSPGDESYAKLPFYAAHGVDEVLIVDPQEQAVRWLSLAGSEYRPLERSALIELGPGELADQIDWP